MNIRAKLLWINIKARSESIDSKIYEPCAGNQLEAAELMKDFPMFVYHMTRIKIERLQQCIENVNKFAPKKKIEC